MPIQLITSSICMVRVAANQDMLPTGLPIHAHLKKDYTYSEASALSMLHRYQDKAVRITTEDGSVFTGIAEVFPSGYGLHEFGREEEGIQLDDVVLFKSDIQSIEDVAKIAPETADPRRFDNMMGELLEGPYWIVDILPGQVPADSKGQYFAVERYFLQPERIVPLRRKYAEILLQLNCYVDMAVSFDACASWETNPDPKAFAARVA